MSSAHEQQVAAVEASAEGDGDAAVRARKLRAASAVAAVARAAEKRAAAAADSESEGATREQARQEPPAGRRSAPKREVADGDAGHAGEGS